jgi:enoyl-CoA hydratase
MRNLLLEQEGGIALVTIYRPDKLNALNRDTLEELDALFAGLEKDPELKVVLLIGAGDKSFVAGADISELAELDSRAAKEAAAFGQSVFRRIEQLTRPVIALVNGFALGGGCELAMACHLRLAAPNARFGQPEVKLGLIPGYGGTQRLARLVGRGRALELCITGDMVNAKRAHEIGLVNQVIDCWQKDESGEQIKDVKGRPIFDREAFLAAGRALAETISQQAPLAVAGCLEAVDRGLDMSLDAGMALEQDLFGACFTTSDMKEGTQAFMEKRAAKFEGK